jgi:hypothetical protein
MQRILLGITCVLTRNLKWLYYIKKNSATLSHRNMESSSQDRPKTRSNLREMRRVFMQAPEIQFKVIHICFLPNLFSGTGSKRPSDIWTHKPPPSLFSLLFSNNCSKVHLYTLQLNGSYASLTSWRQDETKQIILNSVWPSGGSTVHRSTNPRQAIFVRTDL